MQPWIRIGCMSGIVWTGKERVQESTCGGWDSGGGTESHEKRGLTGARQGTPGEGLYLLLDGMKNIDRETTNIDRQKKYRGPSTCHFVLM